ncbi:MAG: YicC/YloC family endoribonuclease [Lautropia sp.]
MTDPAPTRAARHPSTPNRAGPVRSMTGFASGRVDLAHGTVVLDVRTVNSRHVDLHFRLADELRDLEPAMRQAIARHVSRGKVECRMQWRAHDTRTASVDVDPALLDALLAAQERIRARSPAATPLSVADLLRMAQRSADTAGGTDEAAVDGDSTWDAVAPLVEQVLRDCVAAREREGARLADAIARQVEAMQSLVAQLEPHLPVLLEQARLRLQQRLADAMPDATSATGAAPGVGPEETFARIRQEVALIALRGDVAEELERLSIHLAEVARLLQAGGAVGKRIDFIGQELNREANTLASKATGIAVTDAAVSLKLLIEQMREQVQNLE